MKILGLIPARGGSKRLPGKNVRLLDGVPLIGWTILSALASNVCVDVMVSTDDLRIAEISQQYGASFFGLRPAKLATDTATSADVAIHALDVYESEHGPVDGLMLLQPTSPFRSIETIQKAAALFKAQDQRSVVGVCQTHSHPAWCFRVEKGVLAPFLSWEESRRRSQDLSPAYVINGAMYLTSPALLRSKHVFFTEDAVPLVMEDGAESLDIDTAWDWLIAEAALVHEFGKVGG